jgi:hypothetical protein
MSTSGGKGGGSTLSTAISPPGPQAPGNVAARDYGPQANAANAGLHNQLSETFGYTGGFGGGQFHDWAMANLSPAQRQPATQTNQAWQNPVQDNLATNTMAGLGQAADMTQQWADFRPDTLAQTDLSPYQNPYQQDVIDATMNEMNRQNDLQMMAIGDRAQAGGAFGGDRHGIAEAEQNRNLQDQQQRWLANMNAANFNQSQQGAMYDIGNQFRNQQMGLGAANQLGGLANMGFGWGQNIQDRQRQAGMDQFAQEQATIDNAMRQWQMYQEQPYRNLSLLSSSLPGSGGAGTQSSTPGVMDYLGLAGQLGGSWLMCWVAREVYGEDNFKWLQFRKWLLAKAPNWFFRMYSKNGESWAATIKRRPWLKKVLRPMMDAVAGG